LTQIGETTMQKLCTAVSVYLEPLHFIGSIFMHSVTRLLQSPATSVGWIWHRIQCRSDDLGGTCGSITLQFASLLCAGSRIILASAGGDGELALWGRGMWS